MPTRLHTKPIAHFWLEKITYSGLKEDFSALVINNEQRPTG
jgi:hypothetical protein